MEKLYTCNDVATRYSVKIETVWSWIRTNKLRAIKTGKNYRVRESDLAKFEESNRV